MPETSAQCAVASPKATRGKELVALYRLTVPASNLQPRYNIAPTTTVNAIIPRGADRLELTSMAGPDPILVGKDREGKQQTQPVSKNDSK